MKHLLFILFLFPAVLKGQIITTVAGNGTGGNGGDGGPAASASFSNPYGMIFDSKGNLYVVVGPSVPKVRKIDTAGIVTTFAGTGISGFSGDGGLAINAELNYPEFLAVDSKDNIYISEGSNHRIRKVDTNGIITTFAGNGIGGYNGDSILATAASLYAPWGMCFDRNGNLFIADHVNNRVRKIDTAGIITTVAGNGIMGFSGDSGLAVNAQLNQPTSVAFDNSGNLYVAEWGNNRIRKVDSLGIITTIAGNGLFTYSGDSTLAINNPMARLYSIVIDQSDNLFLTDCWNQRIRKVDIATGTINTIAGTGVAGFSGDGGPAVLAELYLPEGLALDKCQNLYISEVQNKRIRKVAINSICFPEKVSGGILNNTTTVVPNPAENEITISGLSNTNTISIINTLGQVVLSENSAGPKTTMNISVLSEGLYFIVIKDRQGKLRRMKFVKE
jgi:sugar lactone lactonase YvrE